MKDPYAGGYTDGEGKPRTDAEYHAAWIRSLDGWIANHVESGDDDLAAKEIEERERHKRALAKCANAQLGMGI